MFLQGLYFSQFYFDYAVSFLFSWPYAIKIGYWLFFI